MTIPRIRHATPYDTQPVAHLIAEAFHPLDVSAWLIPPPHDRTRILADHFHITVDHALHHGEIHIVDNLTAAAVWFHHPTPHTVPEPPDYHRRRAAACDPYTPRIHTLDTLFADHHPQTYPHHHLAYLAVHPHHQHHGLGTHLLRYHHATLDSRGIAAYLEASCPRSRALYERHAYEPLTPFHLPDHGPPLWPMWREPSI